MRADARNQARPRSILCESDLAILQRRIGMSAACGVCEVQLHAASRVHALRQMEVDGVTLADAFERRLHGARVVDAERISARCARNFRRAGANVPSRPYSDR